ncbi:cytoplasmic protein [Stappia sp. 22II-S9-Z10]|nr:cytoplasmic protein [Stappia sp. 22II-S9-Z10]
MATLTTDAPRNMMLGDIQEFPVIANDKIFAGAAVGENGAGYARPLVAGDPFLGFAEVAADNTGGSAGDVRVRVWRRGVVRLTVAGATAITANDGAKVYASDDDTFTTTASTNTLIGTVSRWDGSTDCLVAFDAATAALIAS